MEYNKALAFASSLYAHLHPHCKVLNIAGSVRRQKEQCKDIELICIPKTIFTDMFQTETQRTPDYINAVQQIGTILKGDIHNGRYVQFEYHKENIKIDLFTPVETDYYRQFAIRTGSAEYAHIVIARAWLAKGWCGTPDGLRLQSECVHKEGYGWKCKTKPFTPPPVWQSEEEFFTWLGIEYRQPRYREINNQFNKELLR